MEHITVLKKEAVDLLELQPDSVVVDATYGAGGHAAEICGRLNRNGVYIGLDADPVAIQQATSQTYSDGPTRHFITSNFSEISNVVRSLHIKKVNAILADLGWRTDQFTQGGKGFSFQKEEPLLMTYGDPANYPFTAADIVNRWAEEDIANVIYGYGEERAARRIARAIVTERVRAPILTASQLANLVVKILSPKNKSPRIHPATRTFQALRIAVNDELSVLEEFILSAVRILSPGGVLAIISFHSLEDRIIKFKFRELAATETCHILTKRPIIASFDELQSNPRARSAKLRAIKKLANPPHETEAIT